LNAPLSNDTLTPEGVQGGLAYLEFSIPYITAWQVGSLMKAGATNILVMLMYSWSTTPAIQGFSPAQLQVLDNFTQTLNSYVVSNVSAIPHQGINLQFFNSYDLVQNAIENPEAYGLGNVTAPCLQNWEIFFEGIGGAAPIVCEDPDQYFFWDGEGHPTAKVHAVLGSKVIEFLNWK